MNNKLRDIFQQPFVLETYRIVILRQLLHAQKLLTSPEMLELYGNGDQLYGLGYLTDNEGKEIGLYYTHVHSGDVRRKRVGFRKMLHPYVKYGVDAAIAVFDDGEHWRLSYICDLKGGITSAKRFSYVFGDPKGQYNTPVGRLMALAQKRLTLDELHKTFSVDALSKEFFDEYHRHYDRILMTTVELISKDPTSFSGLSKFLGDYIKKMMGRIVFLHFLQKKGWLNGDPEFLKNLFFMQPFDRRADFLEQVLKPLFFGIFNTEPLNRGKLFRDERWDVQLLEQWKGMPYLNGGLFERDTMDNAKLKLPASLFENLFEFMASYNFTVDENDPDDAEIGVDPEMLGKIFESLLEDNKAKGAFYTPKEIVRYMCKESLIAYLSSKLPDANDGIIRTFVETHEMQPELESYRDALKNALRDVKICDPAIGSGAFPMGLLNELWRCREAVEETPSRVDLKKEIIENNIYGVDIEKGAIDIARLRLWLSIVVDAEEPEPLPNFDYKFMQGNSLIESFDGHDLSHILDEVQPSKGGRLRRNLFGAENTQTSMEFYDRGSRQNLKIWLSRYFSLSDHNEKEVMRQNINESVKNYIKQQGIGSTTEVKINALDPSANQDFFLWHTWFKDIFDSGGFDIVIGNPPYVNIANIENDEYRQLLKDTFSITRNKTDLYAYFIQRAFSLLSPFGKLAYIVPETWKATDSFLKLRDLIINKHRIEQIVNLKMGVFEAIVRPMILILSNDYKKDYHFVVFENLETVKYSIDAEEVRNNVSFPIDTESSKEEKMLFKRVENVKYRLKDIIKFSRGIKTSDDKRFIHNECLGIDYKKVFRGKNIKAYSLNWGGEYVWYRPDLMREKVGCLPHTKDFFEVPEKLVTQRVNSSMQLLVAYDDEQNYFLDTTNVSNYESINKAFSLKFVCGVLNSRLINFWYAKKYRMPTISGYELDTIPFPDANNTQQQLIIDIVNQIITRKKINPFDDTSNLEHQIDQLVYTLYNLTPEEITIIEQSLIAK